MNDPIERTEPKPDLAGGETVLLEEQSLRDGLQNEARLITLAQKVELVGLLTAAGVRRVQIGSFVDPRRVPQMADTGELAAQVLARWPHLTCTALVLNAKGLQRAMASGLRHLSLSVSVSDAHSRANVGQSAAASLEAMVHLARRATDQGIVVRAGIQCAFGCPSDGATDQAVVTAATRLTAVGAAEVNLADTAGLARPDQVEALVHRVGRAVPEARLSLHLHGTTAQGLANLAAGYRAGVRLFDTAVGGLGGCPFIARPAGNVATEEAVRLLTEMGATTGIDRKGLHRVAQRLALFLGRRLAREETVGSD